MTYRIRNRVASIATNDPHRDPSPRVMLERTVRNGRVVWVASERPAEVLVDGRTAAEADAALRECYRSPWDLQMIGYSGPAIRLRAESIR